MLWVWWWWEGPRGGEGVKLLEGVGGVSVPPRGCLPLIPHQLRFTNHRWTSHFIVVTLEHTSQPHILIPQPTTILPDLPLNSRHPYATLFPSLYPHRRFPPLMHTAQHLCMVGTRPRQSIVRSGKKVELEKETNDKKREEQRRKMRGKQEIMITTRSNRRHPVK